MSRLRFNETLLNCHSDACCGKTQIHIKSEEFCTCCNCGSVKSKRKSNVMFKMDDMSICATMIKTVEILDE